MIPTENFLSKKLWLPITYIFHSHFLVMFEFGAAEPALPPLGNGEATGCRSWGRKRQWRQCHGYRSIRAVLSRSTPLLFPCGSTSGQPHAYRRGSDGWRTAAGRRVLGSRSHVISRRSFGSYHCYSCIYGFSLFHRFDLRIFWGFFLFLFLFLGAGFRCSFLLWRRRLVNSKTKLNKQFSSSLLKTEQEQ